jgi:protein SCO1/2
MNKRRNSTMFQRMLLLAVAFGILVGSYYLGNQYHRSKTASESIAMLYTPEKAIAPFSLQRADETGLSNADLQGHWSLFYFGDSYCADVCPAALENIVRLYNRLAIDPEVQQSLRFIFVSLDPLRDTPERLRSYVTGYHPGFIGVSGSEEEVHALAKEFSIYYKQQTPDKEGNYRIDHGVTLSLVSPQGKIAAYFIDLTNPEHLATDILTIIEP